MKILMFVNPYLNLVQPVIDELKNQGHKVTVIEDFFVYHDPKDVRRRGRLNERKIRDWNKTIDEFWTRNREIIAKGYDMFISFNGGSINNTTFELIDRYSPGIVKIQYCWDSFNYVDFRMIENYFDKLYTFDIVDAQELRWRLLPSFFINKHIEGCNDSEDIDCFLIGSNHDRRYSFARKILHALDSHDLNNYIKIFVFPISHKGINFIIDCAKSVLDFRHIHETLFKYGFENKKLMLNKSIDVEEYAAIMRRSRCILDDNMSGQAGLSPRFIRAMALNKKVITTNKWACDYSFVNEKNVLVVDKDKPVIDVDFIKSETCPPKPSNLDYLELSPWVKILIGEIECPYFEKQNNPS